MSRYQVIWFDTELSKPGLDRILGEYIVQGNYPAFKQCKYPQHIQSNRSGFIELNGLYMLQEIQDLATFIKSPSELHHQGIRKLNCKLCTNMDINLFGLN